jgi:hypothetical protein
MIFSYEIKELPRGTEAYRIATDIEGRLLVTSDSGDILLDAEGILLVELAIFCRKWLNEDIKKDFYYSSMDFEEEPILAFKVKPDNSCSFLSVWQSSVADDTSLSEVKSSMNDYIEDLKSNLKNNFQIEINGYEGL